MPTKDTFLGVLKYEGRRVEDGYLDARTSARALMGFDTSLRFLVTRKEPQLATANFEIPVRICRGSWEAHIPHTIGQWILTGLGAAATAYIATAAKKFAENDFKEAHIKDVFKHALKAIQWLIRIGKHLGSFTHRKLTAVKWRNDNSEIGLPNENGEYLYVPREYFEIYVESPSKLLSDIASVVETERELRIALNDEGQIEEVSITEHEKHIFFLDEPDDNQILFPELAHGMHIEIDGIVTRGNEVTNSIGFRYKDHILQCHPSEGSIVRYKPHLFLPCRIFGTITRESDEGTFDELRPKIIFNDLKILDGPDRQSRLL
jgi:hypothetical protein